MHIKSIKKIFAVFCLYIALPIGVTLSVDALYGKTIINNFDINNERRDSIRLKVETSYRIQDAVYNHTLISSYRGSGFFRDYEYPVCTDGSGFKCDCNGDLSVKKKINIAFIGDSFTEGIGLPYEDTFVGVFAKNYPNLSVSNVGVSSYSPSIYLQKIRYLLEQGYSFDELVVFIDISDIQDEAIYYDTQGKTVIGMPAISARESKKDTEASSSMDSNIFDDVLMFSQNKLPLFYLALTKFNKTHATVYQYDFPRGAWTYNSNSHGYGDIGVEGAIRKSVTKMNELYLLLAAHGTKLSVGIYPWPGQILYDTENSNQTIVWKEFCKDKCKAFYNTFPIFFREANMHGKQWVIDKYYINNDVHFNAAGNKIIADILSKNK